MTDEFLAQKGLPVVTRESHPENRSETVPRQESRPQSLLAAIGLSALGGFIGMAYAIVALSSAFGDVSSLLSLIPLVFALVALEAGYWGAMVFMCREGKSE